MSTPVIVLHDTFTAANGTTINNHTPEIGTWLISGTATDWEIQNNALKRVSGTNILSVETGLPDVYMRHVINFGADGASRAVGMVFRRVDASNFWLAMLTRGADGVTQIFQFQYVLAGAFTTVITDGVTLAASTNYVFEGVIEGNNATFYLDGQSLGTYDVSARFTAATRHGLRSNSGGAVSDEFLMMDAPPSQAVPLTLAPNGIVASSGIVNEAGNTTNLHSSVSDPPDSSDGDTTYLVNSGRASGSVDLALSNTPSDFASMDSLTLRVRARRA
jgi:hypothetical protein